MTTIGAITKAAAAVTLAVSLSIAGLAGAGTASADQLEYISHLTMNSSPLNGEITNMAAFLYWGDQVCAAARATTSPDQWRRQNRTDMVDRVYQNLGPADALHGVDYEEAGFIVDQAMDYLC